MKPLLVVLNHNNKENKGVSDKGIAVIWDECCERWGGFQRDLIEEPVLNKGKCG